MKTKGRITGFLCMLLTILYAIYIVYYFYGAIQTDQLSGSLATALVTPHIICVVIAAIFSFIGFFAKVRWAFLVASILLFVAGALFLTYFMLVIVQAVLGLIAYIRMKPQPVKGSEA